MSHIDLGSAGLKSSRSNRHFRFYTRFGKRTLDIVLSLALLPILGPIIILLGLFVARGGALGLFAHERVGKNGKTFRCWKIRTMGTDAEARLTALLAADPCAADEWARTQKLSNDPRVTRLGRTLRRTSIDELPQIWNILRGDMSFVGPRPITASELDRYGAFAPTYLSLKPGVTGHWQIHGRSNGCYQERLKMDVFYAANINLLRDLSLILATILVVIQPTGR